MSGLIAGLLRLDGGRATSEASVRFARATEKVASVHPGAFWVNGPIALAQFDLALPDRDRRPSAPVETSPDGVAQVADLRLYDRSELASLVGAAPTWTDIRLFSKAHERFGEEAPCRLHGDFAFARWNSRTSELQLGRDIAGVRPLYYVHRPGAWLAFASLTSILRRAGYASNTVDRQSVVRMALGDFELGDRSLLNDIRRVRPAHVLTIGGSGLRARRYWRLAPRNPIPASEDLAVTSGKLREQIDRAVRRRLPASGPIGSHLSGGLDSSAVAAMAARAVAREQRTVIGYSIQAPRRRRDVDIVDEAPFVAAIGQAEPNLNTVVVDAQDIGLIADGDVDRDHPVVLPQNDPQESILRDAASRGIGVLLSGLGGDELASYNGRGALAEDFVRFRWLRLHRELRAASLRTGRPLWRVLASEIDKYLLPESASTGLRHLFRVNGVPKPLSRYVRPEWSRKTRTRALGPNTIENRIALFEAGHLSASMELLASRAARYGTAFAFPLLDRHLMEFAIRLPGQFFIGDGENRRIFRAAMAGVLPEMVRTRREKFLIDPTGTLVLAQTAERFTAAVRELKLTDGVSEIFDLDVLEQAVGELPDPEERIRVINRCASNGRQPNEEAAVFTWPLTLARFLKNGLEQ